MYLYCERILYEKSENSYEAILDFNSTRDLEAIAVRFGVSNKDNPITSILILKKLKFEKYTGFRVGHWYNVPDEFFERFELTNNHDENERVIAELKYNDKPLLDVMKYRSKTYLHHKPLNFITKYKETCLYNDLINLETPLNDLELTVRDVGCGNWNEIRSKSADFWLIYDLGGDIKSTDEMMQSIFSRVSFNNQQFIGLISHWDLDHYRAILDLDDKILKLMKCVIAPTKMPDTQQVKETFKRLNSLGIKINLIDKTHRSGRPISLSSIAKVKNLNFFRSCDGSNINQSGIVLTVEGNEKMAVLTGDHHYPQIYNYILNTPTYKSNSLPYEFVVPHHGGNAGNFDKSLWNRINFSSGAMSTNRKRYKNMPRHEIYKLFVHNKLFHCTDCTNLDYITAL